MNSSNEKNKRKIKKYKSRNPADSDKSIVMSLYNSGDYAGMEKAARNLLKKHAHSADLNNLQILPHILKGNKVADIMAILGSIDVIMGSVDR